MFWHCNNTIQVCQGTLCIDSFTVCSSTQVITSISKWSLEADVVPIIFKIFNNSCSVILEFIQTIALLQMISGIFIIFLIKLK